MSSLGEQSPRRHQLADGARAAEPPFPPPERIKTPEGVPHWPVEEPAAAITSQESTPRVGGLLAQLRARGSRALRAILTPPSQPLPVSRVWRPPVSGHVTSRFGRLETHPFASARSDTEHEATADITSIDVEPAELQPQHHVGVAPVQQAGGNQAPRVASLPLLESVRAVSPSQRALQALSGTAVPVTPERARLQTALARNRRSVALPKSHRHGLNQSSRSNSAPVNGDLSARTADLLEQFPAPPDGESAVRLKPLKRRALSLSVFPRQQPQPQLATDSLCDGQGTIQSTAGGSCESLRSTYRTTTDSCTHYYSNDIATTATVSDVQSLPTVDNAEVPQTRASGYLPGNEQSFPVVRRDSPISRPATGTSSYFSAASTALRTVARSQTQRQNSEQLQRAVANGADRFGERSSTALKQISVPVDRRPNREENQTPLTPITVTKAEGEYCPHKLAKLRKGNDERFLLAQRDATQQQLDGTAPAPPPRAVLTNPETFTPAANSTPQVDGAADRYPSEAPATPTTYLGLPVRQPPQHQATSATPAVVSATDFAIPSATRTQRDSIPSLGAPSSRLHTRITPARPAYGTWRTRMKRTKCWKCQLAARRQEAAAYVRRYSTMVREGKGSEDDGNGRCGRLKACLRWTCFARYAAYHDGESSEDEREEDAVVVEERGGRRGMARDVRP